MAGQRGSDGWLGRGRGLDGGVYTFFFCLRWVRNGGHIPGEGEGEMFRGDGVPTCYADVGTRPPLPWIPVTLRDILSAIPFFLSPRPPLFTFQHHHIFLRVTPHDPHFIQIIADHPPTTNHLHLRISFIASSQSKWPPKTVSTGPHDPVEANIPDPQPNLLKQPPNPQSRGMIIH